MTWIAPTVQVTISFKHVVVSFSTASSVRLRSCITYRSNETIQLRVTFDYIDEGFNWLPVPWNESNSCGKTNIPEIIEITQMDDELYGWKPSRIKPVRCRRHLLSRLAYQSVNGVTTTQVWITIANTSAWNDWPTENTPATSSHLFTIQKNDEWNPDGLKEIVSKQTTRKELCMSLYSYKPWINRYK